MRSSYRPETRTDEPVSCLHEPTPYKHHAYGVCSVPQHRELCNDVSCVVTAPHRVYYSTKSIFYPSPPCALIVRLYLLAHGQLK